MEKVTGIGGVFFKSARPKELQEWYCEKLGLPGEEGYVVFRWKTESGAKAATSWSAFPSDTEYFGKGKSPFMINYRVENLDRMLAQLRAAGVTVEEKIDESEFGRFGWATDPEGNRIELWQPPEGM